MLTDGVSLSPAPDMLFELISYLTGGERKQKAKRLAAGEDPDGDAAALDVLAALHKFPGIRPDPEAFIEALDPLQPRVYSISSSLKSNPGRVSLTVDAVRYEIDKRTRLGVCSTFLGGRIAPGDKIRVYVQKAQHFALPDDPAKPIIMIGPGTGIAPFRAFLHERAAIKAPGRNWLFFGHQRSDYDFFYEEELVAMRAAGLLTRLTLAWSRDGNEKIYVQHRMREVGRDLWSWLNDGAHVYVCGDALRMAKDVEDRADRDRCRAWRLLAGRGGKDSRRTENQRPLSSRCLLATARNAHPKSLGLRTDCKNSIRAPKSGLQRITLIAINKPIAPNAMTMVRSWLMAQSQTLSWLSKVILVGAGLREGNVVGMLFLLATQVNFARQIGFYRCDCAGERARADNVSPQGYQVIRFTRRTLGK